MSFAFGGVMHSELVGVQAIYVNMFENSFNMRDCILPARTAQHGKTSEPSPAW